jgi:hypothetical protein
VVLVQGYSTQRDALAAGYHGRSAESSHYLTSKMWSGSDSDFEIACLAEEVQAEEEAKACPVARHSLASSSQHYQNRSSSPQIDRMKSVVCDQLMQLFSRQVAAGQMYLARI